VRLPNWEPPEAAGLLNSPLLEVELLGCPRLAVSVFPNRLPPGCLEIPKGLLVLVVALSKGAFREVAEFPSPPNPETSMLPKPPVVEVAGTPKLEDAEPKAPVPPCDSPKGLPIGVLDLGDAF
jgi:hypothetical protein